MKHRHLISCLLTLVVLCLLAACGRGEAVVNEEAWSQYQVHGKLAMTDSVPMMVIIADHHGTVDCDTVSIEADGRFDYSGQALTIDELYLSLPSGEVVRMFAAEGRYEVTIDSLNQIFFYPEDSLNHWIQERDKLFASTVAEQMRRETMDSLCRTYSSDVRMGLLLRRQVQALDDSVFVRRCLGRLNPLAKPAWVVSDIDYLLSLKYRQPSSERVRLKPLPKLRCWQDSLLTYDFQASRTQNVLMYFWADYDSTSMDSLRMFAQLTKEYGLYNELAKFERKRGRLPRRIELMSICLHAADSAAWKEVIADIPGIHCLLEAGFSEENVAAWHVNRIPCTMVLDRFSTLLATDVWGKELRQQLDKASVNTDKPEEKTQEPATTTTSTTPQVRKPKGARMESRH